ncbi:MAG: hypothetical protein K2J13_05680, partial [Clostridia bacterium]|nr:hypothetical protein [Clostridia bacterium]
MYVSYGSAVRPAFHLNLAKVAAASTLATPSYKKTADNTDDSIKYYNNGSNVPFDLDKVDTSKVSINITAKDMNGNTISSPSYSVNNGVLTFNAQTVGEYTVEVTPNSGEIWADGGNGKLTFTYLLKYHVAPFDVKGRLTQPYNSKEQYFEVDNYDSTKMTVTTSAGCNFVQIPVGSPNAGNWAIAATNASNTAYNVRVELRDTKFMEWDETPSNSSSKHFDITIEQKTLNIQASQIWSTAAYTSATFDLDIDCCDEDIGKLQFVGSYIAPDGTINPINGSDIPVTSLTDKKVTVTIPSTLPANTQNYQYVLELKSGVAANNNYKMSTQNTVNFSVGNKQINLTDADIHWRYANQDSTGGLFVNIGASDLDGQGVFNVEYNINNQPYFLDVDLNQTLGSDLSKLDYTLSGVQETNAGDYTATF